MHEVKAAGASSGFVTGGRNAVRRRWSLAVGLLAALCLTGCSLLGQAAETVRAGASSPEEKRGHARQTVSSQAEEKTEEELYELLLAGIEARETEIVGLGCDAETVKTAARAVWSEHPELFWYAGSGTATTTTLGDAVTNVSFSPDYAYSETEVPALQAALDAIRTAVCEELGEGSAYEKVKGVYEYVIDRVEYSDDINDQDIVASLVYGEGVCGAYARAVQYLLGALGVDCLYVRGETDRGSHAWNLVCIGGDWYHVDATWGDPSYLGDSADYGISYAYLCLTDEQVLRSRTVEPDQALPVCTAVEWNYYRVGGLYLDEYSYEAFYALYASQLAAGADEVSVMFGGPAAWREAKKDLLDGRRLLQAQSDAQVRYGLPAAQNLHYTCDDTLYILTVMPE